MASYMSSIIDVLVTDVLEYLGGPVPTSTAGNSPPSDTNAPPMYHIPQLTGAPNKQKQKYVAAYSPLTWYALVTAVTSLLLLLTLCRRCHRRKRARVAFVGVSSHNQNTGQPSCRRKYAPSLTVQPKYKPVDSETFINIKCEGDNESYQTPDLQAKRIVVPTSDNGNNDIEAKETKQDIYSSKVKEGVKRKLEEGTGAVPATGKKASQGAFYSSQKLMKEASKRQTQQAYTYASPLRKAVQMVKPSNTASYNSDDFKSRWKGSIPKSRLNKFRCRYAREVLQSSLKRNSVQTRDCHLRKQRNMNHGTPAALHISSNNSPFNKPFYTQSTWSPQQSTRNTHQKSSPEKKKLVKRSKTLMAGVDDISGVVNRKAELQKRRENSKTHQDWPTFSKYKETLATNCNQKSPKKVKRSSVFLKGEKSHGQRKAKKARKKHKLKENVKSMAIAIERVAFPEKMAAENYCQFPDDYRGVRVPAVVRQANTKERAESFTIKRTATPVLSSLLGQGAFRTCWPQSENKSAVHTQEIDGKGNTGRHNTNFLGPKVPDCNNETSEATNYSRIKQNIFWNECKHESNPQKSSDSTVDKTTNRGFVFSGTANALQNSCFHIPKFQISAHPLETQERRNIFNVGKKSTETSTVCPTLKLEEHRVSNCFKNSDSQRSEQFGASSHGKQLKQQTECWDSSNKLFAPVSHCDGLHEKGSMHANPKAQLPKERIKGHGQTSKGYEWNLTSQCPHVSSNRNRSEMRIPDAWTHGDKLVQISNQPKDTDMKIPREDLGKRYHNHDGQCSQQCPCVSFLAVHPGNRQILSNTDTLVCEKQYKNNVKQYANNIKQSDAKPCFHSTDKSQTAALSQYPDNAIPVDFKEFRNLWETKVTHEGNVFRLTKNHMLPSRFTIDNFQRSQESTKPQTSREVRHNKCDIPQDSEENTVSVCYRSEIKKGRPIRAVGVRKDANHECSKQLDKTHTQSRNNQLNEGTHPAYRIRRKEEHKCLEKLHTSSFVAGNAQKLLPRQGKSSNIQDNRSTLADSPVSTEWADFGIRVYDRLTQSISSVTTTVDEASGVDSESPADAQQETTGKFTQTKQVARTHCFKNQVEKHMQENSRLGHHRHHLVSFHGEEENHGLVDDNKRDGKYHKHKPTGKASVVHGHVVKRNKSLISVRNMLNELTSHFRANRENNHPSVHTHARKERGKTLYYFKPAHMMHNGSQSPKEDETSSMSKQMHCYVNRSSNTTEASEDNQATGKYVKCYRSQKFKAYRHEPYKKRAPTSSDSTVTPSSGYYWTRNKNNCSPSRKGRYVLGPLVDKHVFPEEQNNSDMGAVGGSGSVIRQGDNRDSVSATVRTNTQTLVEMTVDNTIVSQELDHSDEEQEAKQCSDTGFATAVFPKTRTVPVDRTDKERVDFWNHDSGQQQASRASVWPAVTAKPVEDDSKTDRVSRGHAHTGHTCPAETRYQIIRRYCAGYPEASHTIKKQVPTRNATKGDTIARHITKVCTAKINICKRKAYLECLDKESVNTDHTRGKLKDRVHIVRHDNPIEPITETNELVEDTNTERTETKDGATSRRQTGHLVIGQNIKRETENNFVKDTEPQPVTKKPTSALCMSVKKVDTEAGSSLDRSVTNKHMTKQTVDIECKDTDQHSTTRDRDRKPETAFCSNNDVKITGSLNIDEKDGLRNERRHRQFKPKTLETRNRSQINANTEVETNETTTKDNAKSLFLSTTEASESKSKATSRVGCSCHQLHRYNIVKTQRCLARLKASRGPLSLKYPCSFERNLKSTKAGNLLGRAVHLQEKNNKIPSTQSHTTQTENSINSAHVGVQTSPSLQVATRRTPRHSKMRGYLVNPRLCRDKVTQKECMLSRHKLYRKSSVNASNSLSTSVSQSVQISTEHLINRNLDIQKDMELESRIGTSDKQSITTAQAVSEKQCEISAATRGYTSFSNGDTYTSFEGHPSNGMASNSQELQDIRLNERRNTHAHYGTDKEYPDRKESLQQEVEKVSDSRGLDNKQKDRFLLELSNTQFSGTQNTGGRDSTHLPQLDNREKEDYTAGKISCQTSKDLQTAEVSDERQFSAAVTTPRSNRIRALASSDSSALSSRLSELNKFCVIRPTWKNANIEEIDRRVRRALKLREELKQSGTSGSRARSLIASYFETSAAENTGKSSDGVRSDASSTFASDFDSTNRSTYPVSRDQRTSFQDTGSDDTLCQKGEQIPNAGGRSSSSDDNRTKQGDAVSGSAIIETAQTGTPLLWAYRGVDSTETTGQKTQENTVCDNERRLGIHSRAEYPLSLHDETGSESISRVEIPSNTVASHRPSNSNSGNSIKRAAMKNKNSPPTKISKVENISNNTPKLDGALVQTLPQVPLTSFVEWFIETSDPHNFLPSDRPSSSSDNSPGYSAHCGFDESNPIDDNGSSKMWQTVLFNKPRERDDLGIKNKEPRSVSTASHRKAYLQDNPTCNQSEDRAPVSDGTKPKCYKDDCMHISWKSNMPPSVSSTFPSTPSSATYGMSTLSGDTEVQSGLTRNSDTENSKQKSFLEAVKEINVFNFPLRPNENENLSDNIMKELCTKLAAKRISDNSLSFRNVKPKHKQLERSNTRRELSTPNSQQQKVLTGELVATDFFVEKSSFQKADSCTFSYPVSKTNSQHVAQTTDDASSGQLHSDSTEENTYLCKGKQDKTGRVDSETARNQDNLTDSTIAQNEENTETQPSVSSACTSELDDVNDKQIIRDVDEDIRCAPGIRHILMKLRQTTDVEEFPVPRTERTKITLRKCSDVTGIIARFQKTQP